jgi:YVTN family beta-propeller protein
MSRGFRANASGTILGLALLAGMSLAGMSLAGPAQAYTVYVTNEKGNSVSVIDTETMAVTGTWKVGRRPRGVTTSKDGKELFVCASDDDRIDVLDTATGKVVRSLRSGPDPEQFILGPQGNLLYVANEDDSQVTAAIITVLWPTQTSRLGFSAVATMASAQRRGS